VPCDEDSASSSCRNLPRESLKLERAIYLLVLFHSCMSDEFCGSGCCAHARLSRHCWALHRRCNRPPADMQHGCQIYHRSTDVPQYLHDFTTACIRLQITIYIIIYAVHRTSKWSAVYHGDTPCLSVILLRYHPVCLPFMISTYSYVQKRHALLLLRENLWPSIYRRWGKCLNYNFGTVHNYISCNRLIYPFWRL
jgi:hypothetical protein